MFTSSCSSCAKSVCNVCRSSGEMSAMCSSPSRLCTNFNSVVLSFARQGKRKSANYSLLHRGRTPNQRFLHGMSIMPTQMLTNSQGSCCPLASCTHQLLCTPRTHVASREDALGTGLKVDTGDDK